MAVLARGIKQLVLSRTTGQIFTVSGHRNTPLEGPQMNGVGAATVKRT